MREIILNSIKKIKEGIRNLIKTIKQTLCRHKETELMAKVPTSGLRLHNLRGQKAYRVCKKCGKVVGEYFLEYEGPGFK